MACRDAVSDGCARRGRLGRAGAECIRRVRLSRRYRAEPAARRRICGRIQATRGATVPTDANAAGPAVGNECAGEAGAWHGFFVRSRSCGRVGRGTFPCAALARAARRVLPRSQRGQGKDRARIHARRHPRPCPAGARRRQLESRRTLARRHRRCVHRARRGGRALRRNQGPRAGLLRRAVPAAVERRNHDSRGASCRDGWTPSGRPASSVRRPATGSDEVIRSILDIMYADAPYTRRRP